MCDESLNSRTHRYRCHASGVKVFPLSLRFLCFHLEVGSVGHFPHRKVEAAHWAASVLLEAAASSRCSSPTGSEPHTHGARSTLPVDSCRDHASHSQLTLDADRRQGTFA